MIDPLTYEAWKAAQQAPADFMQRTVLSDMPNGRLAPQQPLPASAAPQQHVMPDGTLMAGPPMDEATPTDYTASLPRPVQRMLRKPLYDDYAAAQQRGQQMFMPETPPSVGQPGYGMPQEEPAEPALYAQPQGPLGQQPGYGAGPQDPQDAWMAKHLPRSYAFQQKRKQFEAMQQQQLQSAAMQPIVDAQAAQQKADIELNLLREKGSLESEAMQRKASFDEDTFNRKQRQLQQQQQQQEMQRRQQQMQGGYPMR